MKQKISIITISYNAENEIKDTIESVITQGYRPLEYVFVDGGSKDHTCEIIKSYLDDIRKLGIEVKYLSEPDDGISDAFNKGIKLSTGDIIGLINAGDGLCKEALYKVALKFDSCNADIVYGNTICIDKKHGIKYLRQIPDNLDCSKIKYNGLIFTHQSAFVRKDLYDKYGLYDVTYKYVMDSELFAKFSENKANFQYLNANLVTMLAGGVSSKPSLALVKENVRVSKKYGGYSAERIYYEWVIGLPRYYLICIIKKMPKLWYCLIGRNRIIKDEA